MKGDVQFLTYDNNQFPHVASAIMSVVLMTSTVILLSSILVTRRGGGVVVVSRTLVLMTNALELTTQ